MPQFIIQVVYTSQSGSMDIFVFSAMLFSVLSAMVSISQQLRNRTIYNGSHFDLCGNYKPETVKRFYNKKKTFKMKIECENLRKEHRYTHKLLEDIICSTLGIDNYGNIEVFYIIAARESLVAFIQVSNVNTNNSSLTNSESLFKSLKQISMTQGSKSESFKLSLNERLQLGVEIQKRLSILEPGEIDVTIGENIKVIIEKQTAGLSIDPNIVANMNAKLHVRTVSVH